MTPVAWNADQEMLPHNARRTRFHCKWVNYIHYEGAASEWRSINLSPREAGGVFTVSQAPYRVEIPRLSGDWLTFESTNRYDVWSRDYRRDAPVGIQKRYRDVDLSVVGWLTGTSILFPIAFPSLLADRVIQFHEQELRDLVRFNSVPPGIGDVSVQFEIEFGTLSCLESAGTGRTPLERDWSANRTVTDGLNFTSGLFRGVKLKRPYVWDSAGRRQPIQIVGRVEGTRFIGRKVIPRSFFAGAQYPVFADTVSTFYPDPDPETMTVDGSVYRDPVSETWANIRDGAGTAATPSEVTGEVSVVASSTLNQWTVIGRLITTHDTSSIPDGDPISSARLALYIGTKADGLSQSISVVGSTPASDTDLVDSDYANVGTTAYSSDVTIASITTGGYTSISLNATGLSNITDVGITKLGVRMASDRDNAEPSWSSGSGSFILPSLADEAGTSQDPYLEVTHGAAAARPSDLLLLGCG